MSSKERHKPTQRFSERVANYVKYRPGYPEAMMDFISSTCGLREDDTVADCGSGTGLLTECFLKKGCRVFGVEPNEAMRLAGEEYLRPWPKFTSIDGRAEATGLDSDSVRIVVAGQAFHWFDPESTKREFQRILQSGGWLLLVWNQRNLEGSAFAKGYEQLLHEYSTDYKDIGKQDFVDNKLDSLSDFYSPHTFQFREFANYQEFDFPGLKGRMLSSSYMPQEGETGYAESIQALKMLFGKHHSRGRVRFDMKTKLYYGVFKE